MADAIERLAAHVVETEIDAFEPAAIDAAKTFILDTFGVALAGSKGPLVAELKDSAFKWGAGTDARIWGTEERLPAPSAALLNAYQAHNSEFDAIHEPAVIHPMASILGALLALAERDGGISGRDFLAAVILGVDVSCTIGIGAKTTLRFFRPATAGSFGAVAALGRAAGVAHEALINAFGIQLGQIGGTMQAHVEGRPLLGMQLGFCTRAAVMAHDMAAAGIDGPQDVLEGPYGYYALFEGDSDISATLAGLAAGRRILEVSHKPFPAGRATHGVIDALLTLQGRHDFTTDEIDTIRAEVPPLVHQLTGRPIVDDPAPNYARLCIPFVGATALLRGGVGIEDFAPDALHEPSAHALARRIEVVINDVADPNALVPQTVGVRLIDGRSFELTLDEVLGSPAKPLSREAHLAKFRRNWETAHSTAAADRAEALIDAVDTLETLGDCTTLVDLMTI